MAEIIQCPSCKRKLQLPESLMNQDVQCPSCSATFLATPGSPSASEYQSSPPPPLPERGAPNERRRSRRDDYDDYDDDHDRRRKRRDLTPHRGGLILALGIIGIVACQILGPIAWIMGNQDMAEIQAGRMDPEGESLTQVGRILGIIGTILLILQILLLCFYLVIIAAVIGGGMK